MRYVFFVFFSCWILLVQQTSAQQILAQQAVAEDRAPVTYGDNEAVGEKVSVNGIDMYFESYGSGQAVVVIHGNGESGASLHNQIAHFMHNNRVVVADNRGHGKSSLGHDPLNYVQMMEDWNSLLEHLDIKNANVIGWSDGGILALLLAIHHPEKVNKMAIMGANLQPGEGAVNPWAQEFVAIARAAVEEMIATKDTSQNWLVAQQQLMLLAEQPNIAIEDVHKITAPVLVMAADKDIIRDTHTLEIFNNLQRAHLAILPGTTHWAPVTDAKSFNVMVAKFFDNPYERPESRKVLEEAL